jgi:hypothetical protein
MLAIFNCSFDANNGVGSVISGKSHVDNTLCLGNVVSTVGACNSAFLSGKAPSEANRTNCLVKAEADYKLDETLRPTTFDSPLVDAGSNVWLSAEHSATDIAGGQRVYNGTVDIGAYEFDWRSRYAQILGSNRLQITNASPEVVALENAVRLPAGASLGLTWGGPDARTAYRFTADLSGGGDLTLESNGGMATCVSGANEFRSELPVNTLGFMCAGAGYADISAFTRRTFGTTFYFR